VAGTAQCTMLAHLGESVRVTGKYQNILAARVHTVYSKWSVLIHDTGVRANTFNKFITVTHHTLSMDTRCLNVADCPKNRHSRKQHDVTLAL